MSHHKAKALLVRLQSVNEEVINVASQCTAEQWETIAEEDGRPICAVFHHIGLAYPFTFNWVDKVVNDQELPPMSRDQLNAYNDNHAEEHAHDDQAEIIAYLRQVTEEAANILPAYSDDQLAKTASVGFIGGKEFSAEWMMEAFAIGHAEHHLASIKAALA